MLKNSQYPDIMAVCDMWKYVAYGILQTVTYVKCDIWQVQTYSSL